MTLSAVAVALLISGGEPGSPWAAETTKPARVESVPDSDLHRIILSAEAAKRIAIETQAIREEQVKRWLLVDGEVEAVPSPPAAPAVPDAENGAIVPVRVRVPRLDDPEVVARHTVILLSLGEDDDDDDESERDDDENDDDTRDGSKILVLTIDSSSQTASVAASPLDQAFAEGAQYFEISSDRRLMPGQRVQVKVAQPDSGKPQKVVPYSAVIYDLNGGTWVYGNPEPLVFVREPVVVEYVHRDVAVLKAGPATGTPIVTVGAAELMGIERRLVK
jgi:hypothetical protein